MTSNCLNYSIIYYPLWNMRSIVAEYFYRSKLRYFHSYMSEAAISAMLLQASIYGHVVSCAVWHLEPGNLFILRNHAQPSLMQEFKPLGCCFTWSRYSAL